MKNWLTTFVSTVFVCFLQNYVAIASDEMEPVWEDFSKSLSLIIQTLNGFENLLAMEHEDATRPERIKAAKAFWQEHGAVIEQMDQIEQNIPVVSEGEQKLELWIPPLRQLMIEIGKNGRLAESHYTSKTLQSWRQQGGERKISSWYPWVVFQKAFSKLNTNDKAKSLDSWPFIFRLTTEYLDNLDSFILVRMNRIMLEHYSKKLKNDRNLLKPGAFKKHSDICANAILHGQGPVMQKILQILSELNVKDLPELTQVLGDLLNSIAPDDPRYINQIVESQAVGKGKEIAISGYFGGGSIAGVYKGEVDGKVVALKIIRKRIAILMKLEGEAIISIAKKCGRVIYAKQLVELTKAEALLSIERRHINLLKNHYTNPDLNFASVMPISGLDSRSDSMLITSVALGTSVNKILEDGDGVPQGKTENKVMFYLNLTQDLINFYKTLINKGLSPEIGVFTGDPHPGNFNYDWGKNKRTLWAFDMALAGEFKPVKLNGGESDYRQGLSGSLKALRGIYRIKYREQGGSKKKKNNDAYEDKVIKEEMMLRSALEILTASPKRSAGCASLDTRIIAVIVRSNDDQVNQAKKELLDKLSKEQRSEKDYLEMKDTVISTLSRGTTTAPLALRQLAQNKISPSQGLKLILEAIRSCGVEVAAEPFLFNRASFLMSKVVRKAQEKFQAELGIKTNQKVKKSLWHRIVGSPTQNTVVGKMTPSMREALDFDPDLYYEEQLSAKWPDTGDLKDIY